MILYSNHRMTKRLKVLCTIGLLILIYLSFGCKSKASDRPLSLGYFKNISDLSLSPDGNQLLFTASGHKDYPDSTIYRFDMKNGKLYRYIPPGSSEILSGGRYSPSSSRFVFEVIPYDSKDRNLYDDMQIAIANEDGSGFHMITQGQGVKLRPAISYDEETLVFFKGRISDSGSPLRKQKRKATGFDLFKVDLRSSEETQLTRLEFYEVSAPYFTPDDNGVVFGGFGPMRLPKTDNWRVVNQFRDTYDQNYHENIIFRYLLDGSEIDREPVPFFIFDWGAKNPIVTKDGSIWFEGYSTIRQLIHYWRRSPDGKLKELNSRELGEGKEGKSLICVIEMTATPDGSRLAIMTWNQDTRQKFVRIINVETGEHYDVTAPAIVENITIR